MIALYGLNLMKLCASRETMLGNRLRPDRVRFSTTRSSESSVYSIRGMGIYPTYVKKLNILDWKRSRGRQTLSIRVGKITFLISLHRSALNFKLPSLSNNKSLVNLAQSSPNRLFKGSSPMALNQFPTVEKSTCHRRICGRIHEEHCLDYRIRAR